MELLLQGMHILVKCLLLLCLNWLILVVKLTYVESMEITLVFSLFYD